MNAKRKDGLIFLTSMFVGVLIVLALFMLAKQGPPTGSQTTTGRLEDQPGMRVGQRAKRVRLSDLKGQPVELFTGEQGYTVLCFTSRHCAKCSDEAGVWRNLASQGSNVRTFLVSVDSQPEEVRRYVEAYKLGDLQVVYDTKVQGVFRAFNIHILPQYLVFNSQGTVIYRDLGFTRAKNLSSRERAESILAATKGGARVAASR